MYRAIIIIILSCNVEVNIIPPYRKKKNIITNVNEIFNIPHSLINKLKIL